jgi:protein-L-isoaspartate(D-aspartate) O-methyltransferase
MRLNAIWPDRSSLRKIYWIFILLLATVNCSSYTNHYTMSEKDFTRARNRLVAVDLSPHIKNTRVLDAIYQVPRHLFVPPELQSQAYLNQALEIGYGQTISQPLVVAMMTEALDPKPDQRVLEIGTGSGYQAAVLSHLVAEVYTVEIIRGLSESTAKLLKNLGIKNIHCRLSDGSFGWSEHAPYDSIIVTAAPTELPNELVLQLKEGGRLVIPVGYHQQKLKLFIKENGTLLEKDLGDVRFVPMTGDVLNKAQPK